MAYRNFKQGFHRAWLGICGMVLAALLIGGFQAANAQEPQQVEPAAQYDFTGNLIVSGSDASTVGATWFAAQDERSCTVDGFASHDVDGNGCIDVGDVQTVLAHWGKLADPVKSPLPGFNGEKAAEAVTATFTVNSTGDESDRTRGDGICRSTANTCTLRAAIQEANARRGQDIINFNIRNSNGSCPSLVTINSSTGWTIDDVYNEGIIIDGYTQCGARANTLANSSDAVWKIELKGPLRTDVNGITILSKHNIIRGLAIYNWDISIVIRSGGWYNRFEGNILGSNAAQTYLRSTGSGRYRDGIQFSHGPAYNVVGCGSFTGTNQYVRCSTAAEYYAARNILSGNGQHGVYLDGNYTNNIRVVGNFVGIKSDGRTPLRNPADGLDFNAGPWENWIGGLTPLERNIISGNSSDGMEISHDGALNRNHIVGNYFGTDVTGMISVRNSQNGLSLEDQSSGNYVYNNVLSGNGSNGIRMWAKIRRNEIYNNYIGVAADGVTPLGNGRDPGQNRGISGIFAAGGSEYNIIRNNIIANNAEDGIRISSLTETRYGRFERSQYNTISQNSMYNNTASGIKLQSSTDPATGQPFIANQGLAAPWIERANTREVMGWGCANCTVEVFISDKTVLNDPRGDNWGEGKTYLGTAVADASGKFVVAVSGVNVGQFVTATNTDPQGNTSPFARNAAVVEAPVLTPTPTPSATPSPTMTPLPSATPSPTATPNADGSYTSRITIQQWGGDAEEALSNGSISRRDGSLDMGEDPYWFGPQAVGLHFQGVPVPAGATITRAYLEFTTIKSRNEATSLLFQAEASDSAPLIEWNDFNISSRARTSASVPWANVPAWTTIGAVNQSPDLSTVLQEVVSRPGWQGGNSVLFVITGTGRRNVASFDSDPTKAPTLVIEYRSATAPQQGQIQLAPIPVDEPLFLPLVGR